MTRVFTRPFTMRFFDVTADNGMAKLRFDPTFDRVPSSRQLVNTSELGRQYFKEVCKHETILGSNNKVIKI